MEREGDVKERVARKAIGRNGRERSGKLRRRGKGGRKEMKGKRQVALWLWRGGVACIFVPVE